MKQPTFIQDANSVWLKGNVHSHTCCSDGNLTPQQMVDTYAEHGFDWLALTDHNRFTDPSVLDAGQMILLNGIELTSGWRNRIHINAFWTEGNIFEPDRTIHLENDAQTKSILKELRAKGCFLTLNHPHWSLLEPEEVDVTAFDAIEVFNYSTHQFENMGLGTIYWDQMLRRGHYLWGTAGDDNHNGQAPDEQRCDSFGGFTVVKAKDRSPQAVLEALHQGSFYASGGPQILDFYIENGIATVQCSPCTRIWFCVDGMHRKSKTGRYLTQFSIELRGNEHYIRAECMDVAGHSAYTNPIFLNNP